VGTPPCAAHPLWDVPLTALTPEPIGWFGVPLTAEGEKMAKKLWDSRFTKPMDKEILGFTKSISFDKELAAYDIDGSIAHARMLGKCNIIKKSEAASLVRGLQLLRNKLSKRKLKINDGEEDIHTAITNLLHKEIGNVADKLHTARSRNDQVALDVRMYCKDKTKEIFGKIKDLQVCFLKGAHKFKKTTTIPSYTHLRRAQCILFSHQLLAYVEMLERDKQRLKDAFKRVDVMPLGSMVNRGTTLAIDRFYVAKQLGFSRVSDNSIDSVSDRDFVVELLSHLAILSMHLSRIAEDFIIWSSDEFAFVEGDDAHYTGSSMMPNKKNPDPFELIRGYAGKIYGDLVSVLVMMKGLPLSYNRDMQLDKIPLFESVEKILQMLSILEKVLYGIEIKEKRIKDASHDEYIFVSDINEYLVTQGYSSRQAHWKAGQLMLHSLKTKTPIKLMPDEELKKFAPELNTKVIDRLTDPLNSVKSVKSYGGTNPSQVEKQINNWIKRLNARI
jgi:argininosuccinate lyase